MATGEIDGFASDHERELYERAHEAAKEAQRQGDAQLQAAVAAAAVSTVYYPVATPVRFSSWSLKFQDRRLEAVYCRKCGSDSDFNDLGPAACELAFCILRLWWTIDAGQSKDGVVILSHVCVAAWCMAMITSQLLFTKWYRQNRRLLLWQFAIVLWSWEGLQLYHTKATGYGVGSPSSMHSYKFLVPCSFLFACPIEMLWMRLPASCIHSQQSFQFPSTGDHRRTLPRLAASLHGGPAGTHRLSRIATEMDPRRCCPVRARGFVLVEFLLSGVPGEARASSEGGRESKRQLGASACVPSAGRIRWWFWRSFGSQVRQPVVSLAGVVQQQRGSSTASFVLVGQRECHGGS
ncbi:uncharacterized protein LOC112345806 isoform X3 [Selaginella moellendorffii]|uniref:uncharacterized protein LOC9641202 isoform X3 n=1 Tax=Selaginella moellendorffii TaxID=88036 RepID=UPI000D1C9759|nr:uncharacterized protein LOC9641202 isoform X3 [Selaginella moellendorffii]XP_024529043.1 uncharacterized protein LOC112345806 isoform X3 [Selaginella moellendorffii]|eukprot:XP_024523860.1 uncharacterized protein LOC9641202 isoform X3 [Selaginella moellendorffii]